MSLCGQSDKPDPLARLVRRIFAAALPRRNRKMAAAVETELDLCRVQSEPLSHDEAVAFVTSGDCGAIATFLGTTRNNFDGRPVRTLMYEAYAPMAESKMREILREARRAYGVRKACALHRVGEVKIGEASVILAFASPHRKDALSASCVRRPHESCDEQYGLPGVAPQPAVVEQPRMATLMDFVRCV